MTGYPLLVALLLLATFCFSLYCLRHPTGRASVARVPPRVGEAPRTELQGRAEFRGRDGRRFARYLSEAHALARQFDADMSAAMLRGDAIGVAVARARAEFHRSMAAAYGVQS